MQVEKPADLRDLVECMTAARRWWGRAPLNVETDDNSSKVTRLNEKYAPHEIRRLQIGERGSSLATDKWSNGMVFWMGRRTRLRVFLHGGEDIPCA